MSITCEKEYTLTVAALATTLRAYYKCEDAGPSMTWVDVLGVNDLIVASGAGFASTTGIVSNGFTVGASSNIARSQNTTPDPAFDLGGGSFTARFWYHTPDNTDSGGIVLFDLQAISDSCELLHYLPDEIEWSVDSNGNSWDGSDGLVLTGVPTGQWNRIIIWYEAGVGFGMKLNNEADVTLADITGFPAGNRYLYVRIDALPSIPGIFDEIGVWAKKWSAAEMLYDWNSGNGRTYPDVPS